MIDKSSTGQVSLLNSKKNSTVQCKTLLLEWYYYRRITTTPPPYVSLQYRAIPYILPPPPLITRYLNGP